MNSAPRQSSTTPCADATAKPKADAQGQKELGEVFGLRWRPARVRKLTLTDAAGRPYAVECHVAFSLGGPFAVEVWQAIPGAPLDMPEAGGVHHIGYWADDLAAEAKRLDARGYPGSPSNSEAGKHLPRAA